MDQTDRKLIELLQNDGRATVRVLAEQVGLSPSGCMRRIQLLEDAGIIQGYQARISAERIGLGLQALVNVELARNGRSQLDAFIEQVNQWPQVLACYATTGHTDYVLHVIVQDLHALKTFIMDRLTNDASVSSVNTHIILDITKAAGAYPLPDPE